MSKNEMLEISYNEPCSTELKHRIAFRMWVIGLIMGAVCAWYFKPEKTANYREATREYFDHYSDSGDWRYCVRVMNGDVVVGPKILPGERCP